MTSYRSAQAVQLLAQKVIPNEGRNAPTHRISSAKPSTKGVSEAPTVFFRVGSDLHDDLTTIGQSPALPMKATPRLPVYHSRNGVKASPGRHADNLLSRQASYSYSYSVSSENDHKKNRNNKLSIRAAKKTESSSSSSIPPRASPRSIKMDNSTKSQQHNTVFSKMIEGSNFINYKSKPLPSNRTKKAETERFSVVVPMSLINASNPKPPKKPKPRVIDLDGDLTMKKKKRRKLQSPLFCCTVVTTDAQSSHQIDEFQGPLFKGDDCDIEMHGSPPFTTRPVDDPDVFSLDNSEASLLAKGRRGRDGMVLDESKLEKDVKQRNLEREVQFTNGELVDYIVYLPHLVSDPESSDDELKPPELIILWLDCYSLLYKESDHPSLLERQDRKVFFDAFLSRNIGVCVVPILKGKKSNFGVAVVKTIIDDLAERFCSASLKPRLILAAEGLSSELATPAIDHSEFVLGLLLVGATLGRPLISRHLRRLKASPKPKFLINDGQSGTRKFIEYAETCSGAWNDTALIDGIASYHQIFTLTYTHMLADIYHANSKVFRQARHTEVVAE